MKFLPGVLLERGDTWNALAFDEQRPVLSSAPVGGGAGHARRIVNLCVNGPDARAQCDDPEATFARLAATHDWQAPIVGLMTGVSAQRLGVTPAAERSSPWAVVATAGVSNAHRAGEPMDDRIDGAPKPGTINIIAVTSQALTAAARAEAIALVAEAKAALLADLGVTTQTTGSIASGTGTDAIAIACVPGDDTPYTGYHTHSGQQLVAAVRDAIERSLRA